MKSFVLKTLLTSTLIVIQLLIVVATNKSSIQKQHNELNLNKKTIHRHEHDFLKHNDKNPNSIKNNYELVENKIVSEKNDSNSNEQLSDDNQTPSLPMYMKILASIFYPIAMILGIGGNTLVLLVIIFLRFTKSVTTFFIVNLAISDLIFALLCIPSTFITAYLFQYWPFSGFTCVFFNYMQNVSVTLTVYTLIWITIDKFWGLVKPLKVRMSLKVCKWLISLSWLFSLLTSLPIAVYTELKAPNSTGDNLTDYLPQCVEQWPENSKKLYLSYQLYNILLLLIQYFIPLIILSFCYIKIGLRLKKSKAPGESNQMRDAKMSESRRKILKMCFIMVLTFMVFWAPIHFINVYRFYDKNIELWNYFADIFFVCHLLAVSRTFVNPFIYAWSNAKFRAGFKYFLCCYCLSPKRKHLLFQRHNESVKTCSHFTRYSLYASIGSDKPNNNNGNQPSTDPAMSMAAIRRQRFRTIDHACGCRSINFSASLNSTNFRHPSNSSAPDFMRHKNSNGAVEF